VTASKSGREAPPVSVTRSAGSADGYQRGDSSTGAETRPDNPRPPILSGTTPCEACKAWIEAGGLNPEETDLATLHHLQEEVRTKDLALLLAEAVELIRSSGDAPTHSKEFGCRACEKETAWMKRADDLEDRAERALGGK